MTRHLMLKLSHKLLSDTGALVNFKKLSEMPQPSKQSFENFPRMMKKVSLINYLPCLLSCLTYLCLMCSCSSCASRVWYLTCSGASRALLPTCSRFSRPCALCALCFTRSYISFALISYVSIMPRALHPSCANITFSALVFPSFT